MNANENREQRQPSVGSASASSRLYQLLAMFVLCGCLSIKQFLGLPGFQHMREIEYDAVATTKHALGSHADENQSTETAGDPGSGTQKTFYMDPAELPLKPPFHLMQLGTIRTGSTFQVTLLDAIANLKTTQQTGSSPSPEIALTSKYPPEPVDGKIGPFVIKSHVDDLEGIQEMMREHKEKFGISIHLFTSHREGDSSNFSDLSYYDQELSNLYNCSMCEIDNYAPIFGLTAEDLRILKEYMSHFEILRQCCGFQQSKYNRYRLHGCNVTELLLSNPSIPYPYCERHDIEQVETKFAALPIDFRSRNSNYNWVKPGDCAKFEKKITYGKDFNGVAFGTCDAFLEKYSPEKLEKNQRQRNKILTAKRKIGPTDSKTAKRAKRKKSDRF